ncbi:MAG TPA: hypothetical protein VMF53_15705 [Alphaproteobacteria bacterium]|nr:hypothetical protein [Alphaproteobacteria bacterium]
MSGFDAFVAIDWSGAKGPGYKGIAVAMCAPGSAPPYLVRPGHRWTRTEIAEWLEGKLQGAQRLLVGFDFAFAWPIEGAGFPGLPLARSAFDLWGAIEDASGDECDFGCQAVVDHKCFAPLFWTDKDRKMPIGWRPGIRQAECACIGETGARPESVFKLIGPKQVGKASLAGMRVLRHLRIGNEDRVSVWPYEPARGSILVEIFPTLFRKQALGKLDKIRDRTSLDRALAHFGARPFGDRDLAKSDHNTDALLSAAALRDLAMGEPTLLADTDDEIVRREGWIFGVPLPNAAHKRNRAA